VTDFAFPGSIAEAAARLRSGELTSVALTEHCLARISAMQPALNAFITVTGDLALATARERDAELKGGRDRGLLHGVPIVHKDCFDTAGIRTTAGADVFRDRVPQRDATLVRRLAAAGAVVLGKTQMNEFAAGMSGKNAFFGDAHNPWDRSRAPGGSSSGSACAVAAQLCLGASGTDGGGSIRLPAAWTGIVGLRPTYGRVSKAGAYPRSYSFDCAGPLAASVGDAAVLLEAMAGPDPDDPACLPDPVPRYAAAPDDLRGIRLGFMEDGASDVEEDVAKALRSAREALARLGADLLPVRAPTLSAGFDYRAIFDILLYEFHQILGAEYRATPDRERRFGPVVRANLERGATIRAADYRAALAARERLVGELRQVFSAVDAVVTPTAPMTALALDAAETEFDRARQFTIPFSLAGLPAISVPCGVDRSALPIGLQIVGERLCEPLVLRIAATYETAAPTLRRPGERDRGSSRRS
jgi:aspartyl-tRNA(Asn)/glutamyl-tRNA(Gln) amidotransferase subunit A